MQKKNVRKLMLTIRILMTFQLAHTQDLVVIHSIFQFFLSKKAGYRR